MKSISLARSKTRVGISKQALQRMVSVGFFSFLCTPCIFMGDYLYHYLAVGLIHEFYINFYHLNKAITKD